MKRKAAISLVLLVGLGVIGAVWFTRASSTGQPARERKILYYVDPMNPAHTSDKPGLAPCGMKMEPVYADEQGASPRMSSNVVPGAVRVSPDKQQLIGVHVGRVEKASGTRTLHTLGRVALDETRIFRVTVPVEGLVRRAGPIVTGSFVQRDEVLATFYNRDFLTAQQTYLYALNTMDRFKDNESEDQLKLTRAQIRAAEENLEFLGMGETQMKELARTREITREVQLRSPVTGLVLARNAFQGLRFDRGTELFRVGEMEHVWVLADVFENEAQFFRTGTTARVTLRTHNRSFTARISTALPQFDSVSRTLKVRLEADNPDYLMRPDMFVDVELPVQLPEALVVPAEAVLDSGLRKIVYVDCGNGVFEPRKVETGWRFGEQIQIASGLMADERIVISGNFLIDSESRMKMAAAVAAPAAPAEARAKDPVCGMNVTVEKARSAGRFSEYQGKTYYFCNDGCKKEFESNPKQFVKDTQSQ